MSPSLPLFLALALGLGTALGSANDQAAVKTLDPAFASFVVAAQEQQRLATPTPTVARRAGFNRRQNIDATETPSLTVVTEAPDSTCGFLSASPGNAITCENGGLCSWAPDFVPAIICADAEKGISFSGKLRCFDRSIATNTASCNDVCQSNAYNLLCTDEAAPFCRTYIYPSSVSDFRCASTSVAAPQSVAHTYSGQTDRIFTTSTWSDTTSSLSLSSLSRTPFLSQESSTTTTEPASSDSGSSTPVPPPSGGGTNVGAIVGGTVGGAAVLALIGFGIFFMRRHSAKKDAQAAGQTGPQAPHIIQPQPVEQYYPPPGASPGEPWKGGAGPPVYANVASPVNGGYDTNLTTPVNGAQYDNVSDIQSTRLSVHSPGPSYGVQPNDMPGTIHEVDNDPRGHHRGGLHEIG